MKRDFNAKKSSVPVIGHLINGKIVHREGNIHDVYDPSTGLVRKKMEHASRQTVIEAIDTAKKAFPKWRNTPPIKRARVMFDFLKLLEKNSPHENRQVH